MTKSAAAKPPDQDNEETPRKSTRRKVGDAVVAAAKEVVAAAVAAVSELPPIKKKPRALAEKTKDTLKEESKEEPIDTTEKEELNENIEAEEPNETTATPPTESVEAAAAAVADDATGEVAGVHVLSEEQTNAALAALQEASTMVIEAKEAAEEKAAKKGDVAADSGEKRKASDEPDSKPPAKRRAAPTRVSWDDRLEMLRAYKEANGSLLIPIRYKKNPSLGKFVHNTREQYKLFHKRTPPGYRKKCSLTADRIRQLDELGFIWSTERTKRQNEDWESRFQQLQKYKEKNGDCLVPHGYDEDPSFAEWIHRQRTTHASMVKDDKPNPLAAERMKKLTDLGFNFTVHTDKWMDHWNLLKEYKEKHGHCQVPTHYAENPKLGRWVHTQRHQRRLQSKGKRSCMTEERIALLNKLDFSWEVRPSLERPRATWQQRLEELKTFHAETGHFRVPAGTHPQLHSWCQEQKQRLKNLDKNDGKDSSKRMGPDRVKSLEEMGFTKDLELIPDEDKDDAVAEAVAEAVVADASEAEAEMVETV